MSQEILSKLVITDVVSISTLHTNANIARHRENRNLWAIIVKYEGETLYTSRGKEYISNINNVIILPKGCSYGWRCVKNGHFVSIEFDSPFTCDEIMAFHTSTGEKIVKTAKKLALEKAQKKEYVRLESIKEVYSIILNLLRSEPHKYLPSAKQQKISPALEHIAENYTIRLQNDDLARLCGLSTVYFRKLFKEVMGQSPIEYIQTLKIERAKEILKSDYGSVSEVAAELGYQNIYDFSRAFKKAVGISPKNFKETQEKRLR